MDKPNYVLKANEGVRVPKNDSAAVYYAGKILWCAILVMAAGSLLFRENLFLGMNIGVIVIMFATAIRIHQLRKKEFVASPFEIWFYDEYLVIYRERHYYDRNTIRKEYDKFFYRDVRKCLYKRESCRMNLFGVCEGVWYKYNKDGTLPQEPTYHMTTDSMRYFYTNMERNVDFVAEIEKHSPIKVIVEES